MSAAWGASASWMVAPAPPHPQRVGAPSEPRGLPPDVHVTSVALLCLLVTLRVHSTTALAVTGPALASHFPLSIAARLFGATPAALTRAWRIAQFQVSFRGHIVPIARRPYADSALPMCRLRSGLVPITCRPCAASVPHTFHVRLAHAPRTFPKPSCPCFTSSGRVWPRLVLCVAKLGLMFSEVRPSFATVKPEFYQIWPNVAKVDECPISTESGICGPDVA